MWETTVLQKLNTLDTTLDVPDIAVVTSFPFTGREMLLTLVVG